MAELNSTSLNTDGNLKGYWRLEDANDSGPNGYNLTNTGTVTFSAGKFSNCADNIQSGKYLTRSEAGLVITTSHTYTAWIYVASANIGQSGRIMGVAAATPAAYSSLYMANNNARFEVTSLTPLTVISSGTIPADTWVFLAGRYNSATNKFAVDLNNTITEVDVTGTPTVAGGFSIGRLGDWTGQPFTGKIDDVAIFDRALSNTELATLYNDTAASIARNTRSLLGVGN